MDTNSTDSVDSERVVQVRCRTWRGAPLGAIFGVTAAALALSTSSLALGFPAPAAMIVFVGALSVGIAWCAGDAEYTLGPAGISRTWRALGSGRLWPARPGANRVRTAPWSAVRSYRSGRELSRSLREVETLEVQLTAPSERWFIHDRSDPASFQAFRAAFSEAVQALPAAAAPERRPHFYERKLAHVIAGLALVATLALMLLAAGGLLGPGPLVRLGVVIVPGTLYIVWRTWLRGR
jgi:hypothetical protein